MTDLTNIQILDSDFEDDQSSQGCTTTMMNEEESPDSYDNRSQNQNYLSPASLNLDPEESEMRDLEDPMMLMPPPMSSRHSSLNGLSLRLPSYL